MGKRLAIGTATILGVLLLLPSAAVGAQSQDRLLTNEEAIAADAVAYAAEFGVSQKEAIRRLTLQPLAGDLISDAEKLLGDEFAGGWIEHNPKYGIVVRFTGSRSPDGAAFQQSGIAAGLSVRFEKATQSIGQLKAALGRVRDELQRAGLDAATDIDVRSGRVHVSVTQSSGDTEALPNIRLAGGDVEVEIVDGTPWKNAAVYGGKRLTLQSVFPFQTECTSGFTVQNVINFKFGVLTAGHCSNALHYWYNGTIHYDVTWQYQRFDADQDWQWHTSSDNVLGQFWDGSSYRAVTGTEPRSGMIGDFVCHYGFTTGNSCGTIQSVLFAPPNAICNGSCANVYAQVTGSALKSNGGDSGGPWFSGGRAYGIHKGDNGIALPNLKAIFNTIDAIGGTNNNLVLVDGS